MDRTLTIVTVLSAVVAGLTAGCGTSAQVESLYIGGWVFLVLMFVALIALLVLIIRYLADGRKTTPQSPPADRLPPPEDTNDPNDWV